MILSVLTNIFGVSAFVTSMIGIVPQIWKSFRTKSTCDISMLMLVNYFVCSVSWLGYGILSKTGYVILSNVFGTTTTLIAILQKLHYDGRKKCDSSK